MMKLPLLSLLTLLSLSTSAQLIFPEGVKYRSKFYESYYNNADSAVFFAKKLAEDPKHASFLRQAVHDDMAYYFTEEIKDKFREQGLKENDPNWRKKYEEFLKPIYNTIYKMSTDDNAIIANTARPLHLWANVHRIQQKMDDANALKKQEKGSQNLTKDQTGKGITGPGNAENIAKIKAYAQSFLKEKSVQKDPYQNRAATYALLMYNDLIRHKSLEKEANDLLTLIMSLTFNSSQNIEVYTASAESRKRRAWNRYAHAVANYYKAVSLSETGKHDLATSYYKIAADYSPDLTDLDKIGETSIERFHFGNSGKETFQLAYRDHLEKYGNKDEMLAALTQLAVRNPAKHKSALQGFYKVKFAQQERFSDYWRKAINHGLSKAPLLNMKKMDGNLYATADMKGKWVLVDFWGSWCGPCREEHPALEKLYLKSKAMPSANLDIITIACQDTPEKVTAYMSEFNYTYPVAMNDQQMTKTYNVQGYPTKALITPEGNYLFIPFAIDWVKFIEAYTEQVF